MLSLDSAFSRWARSSCCLQSGRERRFGSESGMKGRPLAVYRMIYRLGGAARRRHEASPDDHHGRGLRRAGGCLRRRFRHARTARAEGDLDWNGSGFERQHGSQWHADWHHDRDLEVDADRAERRGNHDHAIHRCARDLRLLSPSRTGVLTGTISGTALTWTASFPAGPNDPTPACTATLTGTISDMTGSSLNGAYSDKTRARASTRAGRSRWHPRPRTESESPSRPALPESRAAPARLRRVRLAGRHEAHRRPRDGTRSPGAVFPQHRRSGARDALARGHGPGRRGLRPGRGDGRIVIAAARDFGARGVGVEIDPAPLRMAVYNARRAGVTDRVRFVRGDLFEADIGEATVVTLFLFEDSIAGSCRSSGRAETRHAHRRPPLRLRRGLAAREDRRSGASVLYLWTVPAR